MERTGSWRIELLGGLRAVSGEVTVTRFRTQKTGFLLAYLALYRHRAHARETLAELLWPEDEEAGRHNLRNALSALRRQLELPGMHAGPVLLADRFTVRLNPALVTTDVGQFETLLRRAQEALSRTERVLLLSEAVTVYHDELIPGCYEEWCLTERERLASLYLAALRQLMTQMEQAGELERAVAYGHQALHADPLCEDTHIDLMRLLSVSGQLSSALRQYGKLEKVLSSELGENPSDRARAMAGHLERLLATRQSLPVPGESGEAPPPGAAKSSRTGHRTGRARLLYRAGLRAHGQDDSATTREFLEESVRLFRELGDRMGLAYALCFLGALILELGGGYEEAFRCYKEAVGIFRALENSPGAAYSLLLLAGAAHEAGRPQDAHRFLQENLALIRRMGSTANPAARAIREALLG